MQYLRCKFGWTFDDEMRDVVKFTCNNATGEWSPFPKSYGCRAPCPKIFVDGAWPPLFSTRFKIRQSVTCTGGSTFANGLATQNFICNTKIHLWSPSPNFFKCGFKCPNIVVVGAAPTLTETYTKEPQKLTCVNNGTFRGGSATKRFICNGAVGRWEPNPAKTSCKIKFAGKQTKLNKTQFWTWAAYH